MHFTMELAHQLVALVMDRAQSRRENAALNGEWSDGGASVLETQARFYSLGLQRIIPPEWEDYNKKLDPEYEQYLQLKKKFENK